MIKKATTASLDEIKALTEACALAMQNQGIFQWNQHYPSYDRLKQDIILEELFFLKLDGRIIGIIVLTSKMDEEYIPVEWLSRSGNNLYIHRLAVHPDYWGQGYGQKLMNFAEDFARQHQFNSVRLDTFSQNKRNQRFYKARGYQKLGDIYFPMQSEHPFHCYELLI